MTESKKTGRKRKDISYKTIIIGKPMTDLTKKLAEEPNTDVVSSHTTISQVLKKYGSDKHLYICSQGICYVIRVEGWLPERAIKSISRSVRSYLK